MIIVYGPNENIWYDQAMLELSNSDEQVVFRKNNIEYWFFKGKLHREDGPAVINMETGEKHWALEDKQYTEEEFNRKMSPVKDMTLKEISEALGFTVRIIE